MANLLARDGAGALVQLEAEEVSAGVYRIKHDLAPVARSNSTSAGNEASRVIKNAAGRLYFCTVANDGADDQYIHLFDAAALPINGTVPTAVPYYIPSKQNLLIDFGVYGRKFNNGIVICNSTTFGTKTLGANDCRFDAQYE